MPFGGPGTAQRLLSDTKLTQMASRYNATPASVVLSWQWHAHGVVVNPMSRRLANQLQNIRFSDVKLDKSDVSILDKWPQATSGLTHGRLWT